MKCVQKITRIQLKTNHMEEVALYGIVSSEPDYKLSLILNKKLGISLKNISPAIINNSNGNELTFSRFSCAIGSSDETFTLVSNRTGKNFLLKDLRNIDYIFRIQEPGMNNNIESITSVLRHTETISAIFVIDSKSVKDKYLQYLIP
jgi:hypothetical protein